MKRRMQRPDRKLTLTRETLHRLADQALRDAAGAKPTDACDSIRPTVCASCLCPPK